MGPPTNRGSLSDPTTTSATADLDCPFGSIDGLDSGDVRNAAYEIFFTVCRSSPGFGGRNTLTFFSSHDGDGNGIGGAGAAAKANGVGMAPTSTIKRALGLKMLKRSISKRMTGSFGSFGSSSAAPISPNSHGSLNGSSPGKSAIGFTVPAQRARRPLTSAEIMRQQMRVTDQSDNRLRKTLMRTLVGQIGRRAETIILPLELLRHLKPSDFHDIHEYHLWQKRQLKILEAGLLVNPSIPLDNSNIHAMRFREIIKACDTKVIDTSKNSDTMRILCNSVGSLAWRSSNAAASDTCHWADAFPLNIHLYLALLQAIFDIKDETSVLDEVDELLELMKRTWSTLGINRLTHNVCFTWVLFRQYVATSEMEHDLLCAALATLAELGNDAQKPDRDDLYVKLFSSVLSSMQGWVEKKLLCYHEHFNKGNMGLIENFLPLALSASKILREEVQAEKGNKKVVDTSVDQIVHYIQSSVKNAFQKVIENGDFQASSEEKSETCEALLQLAKETEDLALKERENFSPVLKKWQPDAAGIAAVALHNCYGDMLNNYLDEVSSLTSGTVSVLQRADKLEKMLVQMVVEDTVDCEDGGKSIVREMVPFEVDSVILRRLKQWIDDRVNEGKDCVNKAKETETWNPKSKTEPYALSAMKLVKLAKKAVDDFFKIPVEISGDYIDDLIDGLEQLFSDYINFVASCGAKQSYTPTLPPLTRCNRDSKFVKLLRRATPCTAAPCNLGVEELQHTGLNIGHHPRPCTSRGTQRLYIRLNTLHYLQTHLNSLDKTLCLSPKGISSRRSNDSNRNRSSGFFEFSRSLIQTACQHVSEVSAYRLIFLDSNSIFYESLYACDVANARIRPLLRVLKQNLALLSAMVNEKVQPLALKEVMKASFDAYLMVLLAGGPSRIYHRTCHQMIDEDFKGLKQLFYSCGRLIEEEETVEGVISLMGENTEQLMEDFCILACETSGLGMVGTGQALPMPPTTGRWHRSDPNTILRVLCYRNDRTANLFLKRTFQLAKRR